VNERTHIQRSHPLFPKSLLKPFTLFPPDPLLCRLTVGTKEGSDEIAYTHYKADYLTPDRYGDVKETRSTTGTLPKQRETQDKRKENVLPGWLSHLPHFPHRYRENVGPKSVATKKEKSCSRSAFWLTDIGITETSQKKRERSPIERESPFRLASRNREGNANSLPIQGRGCAA
jgi:hypothetical protein